MKNSKPNTSLKSKLAGLEPARLEKVEQRGQDLFTEIMAKHKCTFPEAVQLLSDTLEYEQRDQENGWKPARADK